MKRFSRDKLVVDIFAYLGIDPLYCTLQLCNVKISSLSDHRLPLNIERNVLRRLLQSFQPFLGPLAGYRQ